MCKSFRFMYIRTHTHTHTHLHALHLDYWRRTRSALHPTWPPSLRSPDKAEAPLSCPYQCPLPDKEVSVCMPPCRSAGAASASLKRHSWCGLRIFYCNLAGDLWITTMPSLRLCQIGWWGGFAVWKHIYIYIYIYIYIIRCMQHDLTKGHPFPPLTYPWEHAVRRLESRHVHMQIYASNILTSRQTSLAE